MILSRPDQPVTFNDWANLRNDSRRSGNADYRIVNGDYFRTMNIALLRGRLFDDRDQPNAARVALISASLAKAKAGDVLYARNRESERRSDTSNWFNRPFDQVVFNNNTQATFAVFQAASLLGVRKVVFASSISAYGNAYSPDYLPYA